MRSIVYIIPSLVLFCSGCLYSQPKTKQAETLEASVNPGTLSKSGEGSPIQQGPLNPKGLSPVAKYGALGVRNGKIVDKSNQPVQLKGMSLFWSQWSGEFWNRAVVRALRQEWKSSLVRAAMGIDEEGTGYLYDREQEKAKLKVVVNEAIAQGMYVIIDWHDHYAYRRTDESIAFFEEMAALYGHLPNVIFEIFNEPKDIPWSQIKVYAEKVITAIRAKGSKNLIIVGTPFFSQGVDEAANDPIGAENIAYTLHFYAASHKQELRDKALMALQKGVALFVTEWGACDYSGNGPIDESETQKWLSFMEANHISWANWSLHDKNESASALKHTYPRKTSGGWTDADLSPSGKIVKAAILNNSF
jgi:endoglucanase